MYCAIVRFLLTQYTFCYSKNPDNENDEGDEEEEEERDENSDEDGEQTTHKSGLFDSDSEGEDVNDVLGRAKPQDKSSYEKRQEKVGIIHRNNVILGIHTNFHGLRIISILSPYSGSRKTIPL